MNLFLSNGFLVPVVLLLLWGVRAVWRWLNRPTGVELENDLERRYGDNPVARQTFLDRMDAAAKGGTCLLCNGTGVVRGSRGDSVRCNRCMPVEKVRFPWPAMIDELGRQPSPRRPAVTLAHQGGQESIRKDGSPDAGENWDERFAKCRDCGALHPIRYILHPCEECGSQWFIFKPKPFCTTCRGLGTIDETLGGCSFNDPEAPCPDCKS